MHGVGYDSEGKHILEESPDSFMYSSRIIERVSDIATALETPLAGTIIEGSLDRSDGGTFIDEDKIIAADVNLLVSVRVMMKTYLSIAPDDFQGVDGFDPGSDEFHDAFGDSYISGSVKGGCFTSIISIRCLDRNDKDRVIRAIGEFTETKFNPSDMNETLSSASKRLCDNSSLENTEISISVHCRGGGRFQAMDRPWDIHAVYLAAAKFPGLVANHPQYTWAILTKHNASRTWNERIRLHKAPGTKFLDYNPVLRYTATLFDNFMKYKGLVKNVQDMLSNGGQYNPTTMPNSIPLDTTTLLAVRTAVQNEMDKIVSVVSTLVKTPEILSHVDSFAKTTKNNLVQNIIDEALLPSRKFKDILSLNGVEPCRAPSGFSSDASTTDLQDIRTPATNDLDYVANDKIHHEESRQDVLVRSFETKMNSLIAPEVWEALLPIRKPSTATHNQARNDLKILAAVCGIHDVTSMLEALVINGELAIKINAIKSLVNEEIYKKELPLLGWNLSFIYQYGNGPMHICSANYDEKSIESVHVSKTSDYSIVTDRESIEGKFPLVAIVYGGLICDSDQLKTIEEHMSQDCKSDRSHNQCIMFDDELIGSNPWPSVEKTGVVFFTNPSDSRIHVAVGLKGRCCLLKEQRQLVELHNGAVQGIQNTGKKDKTTKKPISVALGPKTPRYSCAYDFGDLRSLTRNWPFLTFDNGIKFVYQRAGLWRSCIVFQGPTWEEEIAQVSESCVDGSLSLKNHDGTVERLPKGENGTIRLLLSSVKPHIEVYNSKGKRIWDSESNLDEYEN
jgi:hypothetical protein